MSNNFFLCARHLPFITYVPVNLNFQVNPQTKETAKDEKVAIEDMGTWALIFTEHTILHTF